MPRCFSECGFLFMLPMCFNPSAYIIDSNGEMVCMDYETPLFLEKIR